MGSEKLMGSRYCSSSPGSSGVHGERQQQNHPCTCWPLSGGTSMRPTGRHSDRWQRPILTHPVGPPLSLIPDWGAQPRTLPESWFPWDISVTCACPWGIHYISSIQSSCQQPGEDIRHNSGTKPTAAQPCPAETAGVRRSTRIRKLNVHWLARSETASKDNHNS